MNYKPGSASENDSKLSNSNNLRWSQQSSHVLTESEEIYPSAIRSRVSSHGQKYSPQCLQRISIVAIIRVHYLRNCNILHPVLGLYDRATEFP
jgi:hypothetical protein